MIVKYVNNMILAGLSLKFSTEWTCKK